jgi:transcriptional regulator with XRE-family HTH domain
MERWLVESAGARLRRKRNKLRLTQAELGALFGLSRTMVFEWETGRIAVPDQVRLWVEVYAPDEQAFPREE